MSAKPSRSKLVLVEDDAALRRALQLRLFAQGFDVRAFPAAANVLDDKATSQADVLIIDDRLPDSDGITLLRALKRQGWSGRAVLITGSTSSDLVARARDVGFLTVLEKPIPHHRLIAAIQAEDTLGMMPY